MLDKKTALHKWNIRCLTIGIQCMLLKRILTLEEMLYGLFIDHTLEFYGMFMLSDIFTFKHAISTILIIDYIGYFTDWNALIKIPTGHRDIKAER